MDPYSSFDFDVVSLFIFFICIVIAGTILFVVVKGITEWSKNNNSPQDSVSAKVIGKRTEVSGGMGDTSASTWYYVTFESESGDRQEFCVKGREFGVLAEGDVGELHFQGTRYLKFQRLST